MNIIQPILLILRPRKLIDMLRPKLIPIDGTQTAVTLGKDGIASAQERLHEADIANSHENAENFKPSMEIPGTDTWTDYNE